MTSPREKHSEIAERLEKIDDVITVVCRGIEKDLREACSGWDRYYADLPYGFYAWFKGKGES